MPTEAEAVREAAEQEAAAAKLLSLTVQSFEYWAIVAVIDAFLLLLILLLNHQLRRLRKLPEIN